MTGIMKTLLPLVLAAVATLAAPITHTPRQDAGKLVVAHHIVGNTASYTVDTWKSDIQLAQANGVDGFALNIASAAPFTDTQVANAYAAAAGTNFKLFFSFDMSATSCSNAGDGAFLRKKITDFAANPNSLRVNGKIFASTFAGEACTWGGGAAPNAAGWASEFTRHPDLQGNNAILFAPAFFIDPQTYGQFGDVMDGAFNFNGGWPVSAYDANHVSNGQDPVPLIGATGTDQAQLAGLAKLPPNADGSRKVYMTAAAPWFFTHFGAPLSKNFIFDCDEFLWVKRFQSLVGDTSTLGQTDILQLVTWNDFGESHYLASPHAESDIPAGAQVWVDGFDHTGWLKMVSFLAQGFKTGSFANPAADQLVLWARPHPAAAVASADGLGPPSNAQQTTDNLWAVAILTAPATVTLSTSDVAPQTFQGQAGINTFNIPLTPGGGMSGTINRNGADVVTVKPAGFTFNPTPSTINFNAFVASS